MSTTSADGLVYLLNLTGQALAEAHATVDALKAENNALREHFTAANTVDEPTSP